MPVTAGNTNLYLGRDTKVFIKQGANIWLIPVLNGYAFNQSTNTSEVTLNEMSDLAGNSRRGKKVFNDSVSPSDWSFTVYSRPFILATKHRSVDEVLWANFASASAYTAATPGWSAGLTLGAASMDVSFAASNKVALGTFEIYFVLGGTSVANNNFAADADTTIYRIQNAVVNEANINFESEGLVSIAWSGMGTTITEVTSFDASTAIVAGTASDTNFIRGRFTALKLVSAISGSSLEYSVILTGGSIALSNNITFITPEELGKVNRPVAHVTGTRSISGNFSCYLDEVTNGPIDLYEDILGATNTVTNSFAMDIYLGGKHATLDLPAGPGLQFKIPNAHLEVPQINPDDVISLDVSFSALPSTLGSTDEVSRISYVGI